MKILFFLFAITTILFSCKKDEAIEPEPDLSGWANLGNNIFNDPFYPTDTIPHDSIP